MEENKATVTYTFGRKAAITVVHQMFMIMMMCGVFAMNFFYPNFWKRKEEFVQIETSISISNLFLLSVIGLLGSMIVLAYLTNMTGQSTSTDTKIRYHFWDRIDSDIFLLFFVVFLRWMLYLIMKIRMEEFAIAGLMITVGTFTYLFDVIFLFFYMSLVRRLKGDILLTGSFCYRIWAFLTDRIRRSGDGYPRTRKARERQMILDALEDIASGALDTTLNPNEFRGQELRIAQAVNHIRDGLHNSVQESIRNERMKADLITNVSHDIKTPLTSIVNYAQLLKNENLENEKARNYVRIIDEKSQRLKQLTEDLVEASKISSGNVKLDMQRIDLVQLLYQTGGEYNDRFETSNLEIVTKIPNTAVMIWADGRQLYRAIGNLYTNAAKYALNGSRVHVELYVEDGNALFQMKNIAKKSIHVEGRYGKDLTERFVRGEESRTTEGSGLGLSIAKNLTTLMGGEFSIQVEDDLFIARMSFPLV